MNGRLIVMLLVTWTVTASLASAQLRYVDDGVVVEDHATISRQSPFRNGQAVYQAQFQEVPPLEPSAEEEADTTANLDSQPDDGGLQSPGDTVGGAEVLPAAPIPYGEQFNGMTPVDEVWNEPFDPGFHDESAFVYSTNSHYRRGFWYSQTDLVALLRTELDDIPISADQSNELPPLIPGDPPRPQPTTHRPTITSKSTSPTYQPGVRLTLGRFLGQDFANRDHAIEFSFLGLFEYTDSATIISEATSGEDGFLDTALGAFKSTDFQFGVFGGGTVPGYTNALQHTTIYRSDLNNFELNLRVMGRPLRDRLALQPNGTWMRHGTPSYLRSFLFGLRAMTINDDFRFISTFVDPEESEGFYRVRTGNDMFGGQAGFELMENYSNWTVGLRFKGGMLYNFADRQSYLNTLSFGDREIRADDLHRDNVAAVLEGGIVAAYQIRTNLVLRAAYDALYVTGIASAIPNLGLEKNFPRFEVTGDAIFHGASFGVEMLW